MKYHEIYHDDGFMTFKGRKFKQKCNEWLLTFKKRVDEHTECECLEFTAEIWGIKDNGNIVNVNLTIVSNEIFPYLDMEMYWNKRDELKFQVHMKPNQKLK